MRTKTGELIAIQVGAFLQATFGMGHDERPQHFSLPIIPVGDEELHVVIADIRENLHEEINNPHVVTRAVRRTAEIVVFVAAVTVG